MVEWLLRNGASLAPDAQGRTPLHAICWTSRGQFDAFEKIVHLLVEAGIPIDARNQWGQTPLHEAVGGDGGDSEMVQTLLALGADPDPVDLYGETPLLIAARNGEFYCLKLLLASGADPNRADARGITPLEHALQRETFAREYAAQDEPYSEDETEEEAEEWRSRRAWNAQIAEEAVVLLRSVV